MRHGVSQVEEERRLPAPLDEVDGPDGVAFGELRLLSERRDGGSQGVAFEHLKRWVPPGGLPVVVQRPHVVGVWQSIALVEAVV